MPSASAARNLLFGMFALHNGHITADQLIAAFETWKIGKDRSIASILQENGWMAETEIAAMNLRLDRRIATAGGESALLAAMPDDRCILNELTRIVRDDDLLRASAAVSDFFTRSIRPETLSQPASDKFFRDSETDPKNSVTERPKPAEPGSERSMDRPTRPCTATTPATNSEANSNDGTADARTCEPTEKLTGTTAGPVDQADPNDLRQEAAIRPNFPQIPADSVASHETLIRFETEFAFREAEHRLGSGAFGVVYRSQDREFQRQVALKRLKPEHGGQPLLATSFLLEAEINGKLDHPGVLPMYGLGKTPEGVPFYVMKMIEAPDFATVIDRYHKAEAGLDRDPGDSNREFRRLIEHLRSVCMTMQYAHDRGVLHCDLKPGNIMTGSYGETYVVDWGMALLVDTAAANSQNSSHEPAAHPLGEIHPSRRAALHSNRGGSRTYVGGTLAYMAPEHREAHEGRDLGPMSPACDVFSIGVILYKILTGKLPCMAVEGEDRLRIDSRARWADYVPPRQLNPRIAKPLDAICMKALAARPGDRYSSVKALSDDLEQWLADETVTAYSENPIERSRRWARRHRTAVVGVAVSAVAAVVLLAVGLVLTERARRMTDRLRVQANAAKADALRTALDGFHLTADSSLSNARMLRTTPGQADPRARALKALKVGGEARLKSRSVLADLGVAAGNLARTEPALWAQREEDLRNEAVWWLTQFHINRVRDVIVSGGLVATEERSRRIAVLGPQALEIFDEAGLSVRRIPIEDQYLWSVIPSGPGQSAWPYGSFASELSFPSPDQVEFRTRVRPDQLPQLNLAPEAGAFKGPPTSRPPPQELLILRWSLSDGRLTRETAPVPEPLRRPVDTVVRDVVGTDYLATVKPDRVEVRPRAGGEAFVVWTTGQHHRASFSGPVETCRTAFFAGSDPRALMLLIDVGDRSIGGSEPTSQKLLLIDVATGNRRELIPGGEPRSAIVERALTFGDGFLTFERMTDNPRNGSTVGRSTRLAFWSAAIPSIRIDAFAHDRPEFGDNSGVRAFAASDGQLISTGGSSGDVRCWNGSGRLSPPPEAGWNYQNSTLGYSRSGDKLFVSLRDSRGSRLEVFDARSGELIRTWPLLDGDLLSDRAGTSARAWADGDILKISNDGRFAVIVAAGAQGGTTTLELWSLDDLRLIGPLGEYPRPDGQANWTTVQFSEQSRRLFVLYKRGTDCLATFWKLDPLARMGEVPFKGHASVSFPDEQDFVRIGQEIFDFAKPALRCELEPLVMSPGIMAERSDLATVSSSDRWVVGFYRPGGFHVHEYQCVVWNLSSGKQTRLGEPNWSNQTFHKPKIFLKGDRLFISAMVGPFGADPVLRSELWDLSKLTLIRRSDESRSRTSRTEEISVSVDEVGIISAVSPAEGARKYHRWAWADGRVEDVAGLVGITPVHSMKDSGFRPHGWPRSQWDSSPYSQTSVNTKWILHRTGDATKLRFVDEGRDITLEDAPALVSTDPYGYLSAAMDPRHSFLALTYPRRTPEKTRPGGIWDVSSGRRLMVIADSHSFLGIDPAGELAFTSSGSTSELIVTELRTGKEIRRSLRQNGTPSNSGTMIAASSDRAAFVARGTLYLWDSAADKPLAIRRGTTHSGQVISVAQHTTSGLIATGDNQGTVIVRERDKGRFLRLLDEHSAGVSALVFSPDGTRLAAASPPPPWVGMGQQATTTAPTVIVWDLKTFSPLMVYRGEPAGVGIVAVDYADPRSLIAATSDGRLLRLDIATGRVKVSVVADPSGVRSLGRSPGGSRVIVLTQRGQVQIRESVTLAIVHEWEQLVDDQAAAFHRDNVIVTGGRAIRLRDAATGRTLLTLEPPDGPVRLLAVPSGSDQILYSCSSEVLYRFSLNELQGHLRQLNLVPEVVP